MSKPWHNRLIGNALRLGLMVAVFVAMAAMGTYVALTLIIKGEETVTVPDLVGRDVLNGLEALSDLGLNTRVRETVYDDDVPRNHIIDQRPEPGTSIKRGREVRIRVSRGPESVIVPDLVGLSLQQSRILLTQNGLCPGVLSRLLRVGTKAGEVIVQYPAAGTRLVRNQCVDLLVSRGTPVRATAMIDLGHMRIDTALARLEKHQLDVGAIETRYRPDLSADVVIDQKPPPGWRVTSASRVTLTVNRGKAATDTGNGTASRLTLFRFSPGYGFYRQRVRIESDVSPLAGTLFDDFVDPGQEIWLLAPKNGTPSLRVFVDGQPVDSQETATP